MERMFNKVQSREKLLLFCILASCTFRYGTGNCDQCAGVICLYTGFCAGYARRFNFPSVLLSGADFRDVILAL